MKRPLIYIFIYFIFGLISEPYLNDIKDIALYILLILFSEVIFMRLYNLKIKFIFTITFVIGMMLSLNLASPKSDEIDSIVDLDKKIIINGIIENTYLSKNGYRIIELCSKNFYDGKKYIYEDLNINIICEYDISVENGLEISAKGKLKKGKPAKFLGMFSEKNYMLYKNIDYSMYISDYEDINIISYDIKKNFNYYINNIRNIVNNNIDKILPLREGGILKAMITGEKRYIDDYYRDIFKYAGISHILAVSGLHISVISGFIYLIFSKVIKLTKRLSSMITIPFVIMFMIFCGFTSSVTRACIMSTIILFGNIIYKESNILNSVAFAGIIILLISPYSIYDVGFQLSFTASIGVGMGVEIMQKYNFENSNGIIKNFLFISMGAYIMTIPLCMYYFYGISISSIFINIIVVPISSIIVIMGFVSVIASFISNIIGEFLAGSIFILISLLKFLSENINIYIETGNINVISIILFYLVFLCIYISIYGNRYMKYISILLSILFFISINIDNILKRNEIMFIDTNGNSAIYTTYDGFTAVIDAGGDFREFGKSTGINDIIPYLNYKGINSIDILFISNMNIENSKGAVELIKYFDVKNVIIPKYDIAHTGIYMKLMEVVDSIYEVSNGDIININDEINFEILYPFSDKQIYDGNENHSSIVIKLNDRNNSILFTSNIEYDDQKLLLNEDIVADILKIPNNKNNVLNYDFVDSVNSNDYIYNYKLPYDFKNLFNSNCYDISDKSLKINIYKNHYKIIPITETE